ncbi:MAG TPA: NAD(P)H-dependent oxidoreductase [Candidatus Obscuribacter sp.]|nr:NAD(P)H-dependent oxidoreductase [Candidatus Obscuribacter sp.]HMY54092.1 NAD(P)H-dependent oxidoreductase [Candidatus Obscuribacter sp.]HNB13891.1 NAD(P)H-dependent oxidoreductase [Candidatus Obscuribacter sp.]HND08000.1 NAD(P)H-dependent oxidoreductase [Candidatus Obscuribacter sp.]HND65230.1 NAD(P)H-dependent oxidoreductase [Candidatus Obscuribacter sp.]
MLTEEKKLSGTELLASLNWRYACKNFDSSKKLSEETWNALEQSLILSASSFGLQPWKFVVVTDQKIKEQLPEFSWGQRQPADCSHLVVISRLNELTEGYVHNYLDSIAATRSVSRESLSSYADMMLGFLKNPADKGVWMEKQCYIALGTLLTSAAVLGVDACPMEGFDAKAYDRILGLEAQGCKSVVVCPLGYRAEDKYSQLKKVRFPASDLVVRV